MSTAPPPIRVRVPPPAAPPLREPLRRTTSWDGDLDGVALRTVTARPTKTGPRLNRFAPAPPGTPCCLSKCPWPADHLITFHQTGGTAAYCDDHGWPFKPRRAFR